MAYFAKIGSGDIVESVVVINDDIAISEQAGSDFLNTTFKTNDVWKQTYVDGSSRKNYAGIGYSYDGNLDAFIRPRPYPSWTLDEETCWWNPPVDYPSDYEYSTYRWDESNREWEFLRTATAEELAQMGESV